MTRPVMLYEYWRPDDAKWNDPWGKRKIGVATFHQWGAEYEEFEAGPGNASVAIIEMPDGEVRTIQPNLIKFTDIIVTGHSDETRR